MSTTIPEEGPHRVVIQKIIPHVGEHLRTLECVLRVGQNFQFKSTEKLAQKVKQLRMTIGDLIGCFQLKFTSGRNRLLPQSFGHTLHRREESSSPILHAARRAFPHPTPSLSSLPPFFLPPNL